MFIYDLVCLIAGVLGVPEAVGTAAHAGTRTGDADEIRTTEPDAAHASHADLLSTGTTFYQTVISDFI